MVSDSQDFRLQEGDCCHLPLTQMMYSCTCACKHSYHGARPDQSVDGVFIDGDHSCPCQANTSGGLGLVPCLVPRFHDWQFLASLVQVPGSGQRYRCLGTQGESKLSQASFMTFHDKLSMASGLHYFWMLLTFDLTICADLCCVFTGWINMGRMAKLAKHSSWNQRQVKQGGFLSGHDFGNHPDVVQQRDVEGDSVKWCKSFLSGFHDS